MMHSPAALHVKNAPSTKLVFTYLLSGVAFFVFLACWTFWKHTEWGGFFANTRFLAWVHLAILGWINLTIFGVLFQFIPVVLNVRLGSERLAWWQLGFYLPGVIGMVACFWWGRLDWPLHSFASVLLVGFLLFIWNMLVTFREVKAWTWTARYLYAGVLYLLATIMLGLFLSIHLAYPMVEISHLVFLKIHAQVGFAGWILCIVVGAGLKLLPMFLLSHGFSQRPAAVGFWLIHAGLISWAVLTGVGGPALGTKAALLVLTGGIAACLWQVVVIYRRRNRVRSTPSRKQEVRKIEFPLRFAAGSFAALALTVLLGLIAAWGSDVLSPTVHNRLVTAYGALLILGFLGLIVQSFLYKIAPFLVWLHKFRDLVGRVRVPNIRDLVPAVSAVCQLSVYSLGALGAVATLGFGWISLAPLASGALAISAVWLVINLVVVWKRAVPLGPIKTPPNCEPPIRGVSVRVTEKANSRS